jgi:ubiquinone biosynthesis accessory factor UbiK
VASEAENRLKYHCAKLERLRRKIMLDPKILEDFGNKMSALLANSPAKDIEKNAKALMSGVFGKLDLVTREEFDIQTQLLARTRERLQALEARVEALEKARDGAQ